MKHLTHLNELALEGIVRGIKKCALGKPVSFSFEEGMSRRIDNGKLIEVPNGTYTFRLEVNGGAVDMGLTSWTNNDEVLAEG